MLGPRRSILFPPIGPTVVQLLFASQTVRDPVAAFPSSAPAATFVLRANVASAAFARPEPVSLAVQVSVTFVACHCPSGTLHVTAGGVVSGATSRRATVNGESDVTVPQITLPVGG